MNTFVASNETEELLQRSVSHKNRAIGSCAFLSINGATLVVLKPFVPDLCTRLVCALETPRSSVRGICREAVCVSQGENKFTESDLLVSRRATSNHDAISVHHVSNRRVPSYVKTLHKTRRLQQYSENGAKNDIRMHINKHLGKGGEIGAEGTSRLLVAHGRICHYSFRLAPPPCPACRHIKEAVPSRLFCASFSLKWQQNSACVLSVSSLSAHCALSPEARG